MHASYRAPTRVCQPTSRLSQHNAHRISSTFGAGLVCVLLSFFFLVQHACAIGSQRKITANHVSCSPAVQQPHALITCRKLARGSVQAQDTYHGACHKSSMFVIRVMDGRSHSQQLYFHHRNTTWSSSQAGQTHVSRSSQSAVGVLRQHACIKYKQDDTTFLPHFSTPPQFNHPLCLPPI